MGEKNKDHISHRGLTSFVVFVLIIFIICAISIFYSNERNADSEKQNIPGKESYEKFESQEFLMGTVITQQIYVTKHSDNYADNNTNDGGALNIDADDVLNEVNEKLKDIERKMFWNSSESEIFNLNQSAGKDAVKLSKDTIYVLCKAKEYCKLTEGAFDPTVGPLVNAWGISINETNEDINTQKIPEENEIKKLLLLVNCGDLYIDKENNMAKLAKTGQMVDLGGIAKGYAGDEAINIYKKYGITSAYINLGGNVVTLGAKPDGTPWRIGIQNPRDSTGKYVGVVEVVNKAVITSGDYERYIEVNGKRYHHIIDPKTGYPAESGLISTTIITGSSIMGDALSTAVFVLGLEKGMELVESLDDVECIFITNNKDIYVSSGLIDNFTFNNEANGFNYIKH